VNQQIGAGFANQPDTVHCGQEELECAGGCPGHHLPGLWRWGECNDKGPALTRQNIIISMNGESLDRAIFPSFPLDILKILNLKNILGIVLILKIRPD
jgi:hypothetical protein